MNTVTIYGRSDDLIEVDGDIREEWSPEHDDQPTFLAFSDGTVLSVRYGEHDACWRIALVHKGSAEFKKTEGTEDDGGDYSDRVTLTGDIRWVVLGSQIARSK